MHGLDMPLQNFWSTRTSGVARGVLTLSMLCVGGCESEQSLSPALPDATSQYSPLAFVATVDARTRAVAIVPPPVAGAPRIAPALGGADQPTLSLLGSDVVRLIPSNVRISELGAFVPNKLRVTFDVTIENRLPSLVLVAPTWPSPPAPAVILFPLDYAVTLSPGGVVGGDGNAIGVGLPGRGAVTASVDWNGIGESGSGAPYNFFTDTPCAAATTVSCVRWIAYGARLLPSESRATRTVGFDIDPSVAQFRVRMIVAADLQPAISPAP